jgi:hypothetical protein
MTEFENLQSAMNNAWTAYVQGVPGALVEWSKLKQKSVWTPEGVQIQLDLRVQGLKSAQEALVSWDSRMTKPDAWLVASARAWEGLLRKIEIQEAEVKYWEGVVKDFTTRKS